MWSPKGTMFARQAATILRAQADRLETLSPPVQGGPWTLRFDALEADFSRIRDEISVTTRGGDRCIYVFELTDPAAIAALHEAMARVVRNRKDDPAAVSYKGAQYNRDAVGTILYVGSSFATAKRDNTLLARIKQHLGLSNLTTYAMHLDRWAKQLPGDVRITVYQFALSTERDDVLAIEDYLSETLKPLLGRRGRAR